MDSQVKERIVGATVLVALGVWLIPWVLNGSGTDEESVSPVATPVLAPAEDRLPVRTETVNLDPRASDQDQLSEAAPESVAVDEPGPLAANSSPESQLDGQGAPPAPAQSAAPPEVATQADEPPQSDEPAVAEPAVAEPVVARTPANEDPEPGWIVQLGSFGEEANARQLAGRVADYGFDATVTEFETRERVLHRVRIAGYATRAAAEAAASSLAAHGFVAQVVSPED